MVDLSNIFDVVSEFPVYLSSGIIYVLVSIVDLILSIVDLFYSMLATVLNIILYILNFLPNLITLYLGWLFELHPMFESLVLTSIYLIYIIVVVRLLKLLWDLIPVL